MTEKEIKDYLKDIFNSVGKDFDYYSINVKINGRLTRTLGKVKFKTINNIPDPYVIEFSKHFLETTTKEDIIDVIKHEAAHALVAIETGEKHGHDKVFKQMCARIGTNNDGYKTVNLTRTVNKSELYKYSVYCKDCGKWVAGYHRAGKVVKQPQFYNCKCGGQLSVTQNW